MHNTICGIKNIGNTCYVSSVVSLLLTNKSFCELVQKNKNNHEIIAEFAKISASINAYYEKNQHQEKIKIPTFDPTKFYQMLIKNSNFEMHKQEDAHELLIYFIDLFETSIGANENLLEEFYRKCYYYHQTIVFCNHCKNKTEGVIEKEAVLLLSLQKSEMSLAACMNDIFTAEEHISGYTCDQCKKINQCVKQIKLLYVPDDFYLCIPRFSYTPQKNKTAVSLVKKLKINDIKYKFNGAIYHIGNTINRGHYVSSVQNYVLDDDKIHLLESCYYDENDVYIIHLARCGSPHTTTRAAALDPLCG